MNKEALFRRSLFLIPLFLAIAGTQFGNLVFANPYMYHQVSAPVSPPPWVEPPSISIFSPKNDTIISSSVSLNFSISVVIPVMPELFYYYLSLSEVYFKASWLSNNTNLDLAEVKHSIPNRTRTFSEDSLAQWGTYWTLSGYELNPNFSIELTGIPEGPQSIEVIAVESGSRKTSQNGLQIYYGKYRLIDSSTVNFTVDNPAPFISVITPEVTTYDLEVPLNFTVNEETSWMGYSLDGQDNVTLTETTLNLTELADGSHTLTVYATDTDGKTGASKTIRFTIAKESESEQPDQLNLILAGALTCLAIATVLGLLIYLKKRDYSTRK